MPQHDAVGSVLEVEVEQQIRARDRTHARGGRVRDDEDPARGNRSRERQARTHRSVGSVDVVDEVTGERSARRPVELDEREPIVAPDRVVEHFGDHG